MHFVCVSLYFWPWVFYQLPIKGMLGAVCGYMQHDFHLPKVKALAAQESEVPGAQRTCSQESGGLSITVLQLLPLLFQKIQHIHSLNIGNATLLQQKCIPSSSISHGTPGLANATPPRRGAVRRGWAGGSEWHLNTSGMRFSCRGMLW